MTLQHACLQWPLRGSSACIFLTAALCLRAFNTASRTHRGMTPPHRELRVKTAQELLRRYEKLVSYWIGEKYTLRYTGGMVPDVFQIIVKEKGVFSNVTSPSTKAKLRILFEVAPLGLLVRPPLASVLHAFSCNCR